MNADKGILKFYVYFLKGISHSHIFLNRLYPNIHILNRFIEIGLQLRFPGLILQKNFIRSKLILSLREYLFDLCRFQVE